MNKGFTLIETLIALMIISLSFILLIGCLYTVKSSFKKAYLSEDEMFIRQIRLIYSLSNQIKLENNILYMNYLGEDIHFQQQNNKLVLFPGYQVFLNDLKHFSFYLQNDCIYLNYQRSRELKRIIGC